MPGVFDYYNQASSVQRNQPSNIKRGSFAPASSNYNNYHFHGGSGANSSSYISKVVGKRNLQPPVRHGTGYNPYGSSCYDTTVNGYGTTANVVGGCGGFGGHVNTRAYGKPCGPGVVYEPPGNPRCSWSNQVSSGYVSTMYGANTGYEKVVSWNTHGNGDPFSCHTGQQAGIEAGYGKQRYGGSEGPYGNQSGYGVVGDHGFDALAGNSTECGAQSSGSGYINSSGIAGYSNTWRPATSQRGNYGAVQSTLYNGGYGFAAHGAFINDLPTLSQGIQKCSGLSESYIQAPISGNVNKLIEINKLVEQSLPNENVQLPEADLYPINGTVDKDEECAKNFKIEMDLVQKVENVIKKEQPFEAEEVRESQSLYSRSISLDNITNFRQSATFVHDILENETLHPTHSGTPSFTNDLNLFVALKNDEKDRKNFKKRGYSKMKSEVVVKAVMDESSGVHVGHLAEAKAKAEMDGSKGVQVGHLEETSENLVVIPSRKRNLSSSTHLEKIFTQKEVIKSRGRCLVEFDSYYTSHYDLQDFLTSQKRPKNDKDMRLGVGAENSKHFRMPDEAIHFVRGGTFNSNDCLKFNPPPNFFYRKSKALQDLDWK